MRTLFAILFCLSAWAVTCQAATIKISAEPNVNALSPSDKMVVNHDNGNLTYTTKTTALSNLAASASSLGLIAANGGGGTNNAFTNSVGYYPARLGTRIFPAPTWQDDVYQFQPSGVGSRASWIDASNYPIYVLRHDTQYTPPVHALYVGGVVDNGTSHPGWQAMNYSIDSHFGDGAGGSLNPNPRFTWIFGTRPDFQYRMREAALTIVYDPSNLYVPAKLSAYNWGADVSRFNLDRPIYQTDYNTNQAYGSWDWSTSILGKNVYISTVARRRYAITNFTLMTNMTLTLTVNGVTTIRTNNVSYPIGIDAPTTALNLASNLSLIPNIDAYVDPLSPTNVFVVPLYGVQTLFLTMDANSGVRFLANTAEDGSLFVGRLQATGTNTIWTTNLDVMDTITVSNANLFNLNLLSSNDGQTYRNALNDDGSSALNVGQGWTNVRIGSNGAPGDIIFNPGVVYPETKSDLGSAGNRWGTLNVTNVTLAPGGTFTGNGAGITGLPASAPPSTLTNTTTYGSAGATNYALINTNGLLLTNTTGTAQFISLNQGQISASGNLNVGSNSPSPYDSQITIGTASGGTTYHKLVSAGGFAMNFILGNNAAKGLALNGNDANLLSALGTFSASNFTARGSCIVSNGVTYSSNVVGNVTLLAQITAQITNGSFVIAAISNNLVAFGMSNNVMTAKNILYP